MDRRRRLARRSKICFIVNITGAQGGLVLVYMVLSGFAFASLDLLRKLLAGKIDPLALVFYMSLGSVPFLSVCLLLGGIGPLSLGYVAPGLGALVLNFLGSLGFIYSVKLSPLSRTIPLLSLTPVFTALVAIPVLGELPNFRQAAGVVLVVLGAVALNTDGDVLRPMRGISREKGAVIMTGVALLWSLSGPLDKKALEFASVYFHATVMTLGVSAGALLVLALRGRLELLRAAHGEYRFIAAAVVSITLALVFQLLAIQSVFVSLVEAFKRALGSFMALVLGRLVFGETIRTIQIVSVLVMVAGVFLVLT